MKLSLPKPKNLLHFGFILMIIKVSFSASGTLPYNNALDDLLSYISAGILALHILSKNYSAKTLMIYAVIAILALYSTAVTKQYGFLITVISCLALRDEHFESMISFIFRWEVFFLVFHTCYSIIYSVVTDGALYGIYYGKLRYHFGFSHPNMFSIYLFNLILMWLWLNFSRLRIKDIISIFIIALLFQMLTGTRTSFFNTIVVLLVIVLLKKRSGSFVRITSMFIALVFSVLEFLACKIYTRGNPIVIFLDQMFSARIRLGSYAYNHYGLTLFGQNMEHMNVVWDSSWKLNGFTFDCTYTFLMMNQGLIWLFIVIIGFYFLSKRGSDRIWVMIISWSLYAVTEVHGLNGFKCFPIFLLVLLFQKKGNSFKLC